MQCLENHVLVALQYYKANCEMSGRKVTQGLSEISRKAVSRLALAVRIPDHYAAHVLVLERTHIYADVNAIKHAPYLFRKASSFFVVAIGNKLSAKSINIILAEVLGECVLSTTGNRPS